MCTSQFPVSPFSVTLYQNVYTSPMSGKITIVFNYLVACDPAMVYTTLLRRMTLIATPEKASEGYPNLLDKRIKTYLVKHKKG